MLDSLDEIIEEAQTHYPTVLAEAEQADAAEEDDGQDDDQDDDE
jgi:hypothetical protein